MDDLWTLGSALSQDEPTQEVVDRSRHRLLNHMRGDRPVRTRTWLPITAALTAVAAVAAVALVVLPSTGTEVKAASGQDVLLAAATAAEQVPETFGAYWHLSVGFSGYDDAEFWTTRDGESWYRNHNTDGAVWASEQRLLKPFALASGVEVTLDELRALPTDPAALRAWVETAARRGLDRDKATMSSLVALVSTVPAPPAVQATAFRVLATYPGIKDLGPVPGGQSVQLPGNARIVVDVAVGRVKGVYGLVVMSMYVVTSGQNDVTLDTEWTDKLPL